MLAAYRYYEGTLACNKYSLRSLAARFFGLVETSDKARLLAALGFVIAASPLS